MSKTHAVVSNARMSLVMGAVSVTFACILFKMAHDGKRKREEIPEEYMTMETLDKRVNAVRDI
jgi:hypothetical protein